MSYYFGNRGKVLTGLSVEAVSLHGPLTHLTLVGVAGDNVDS